jgi:hypothetical protein
MKHLIALVAVMALLTSTEAFTPPKTEQEQNRLSFIKDQTSDLVAFTETDNAKSLLTGSPALQDSILPVMSTAMLITGNTVGASMLVLPELAAGPGMAISSAVLLGAFAMNWLSGLCIAQVAIQQYETSGDEVPSSFKEFAQTNLFEGASSIVSGIAIVVNSLVLAFDTTKAGQVLDAIGGSPLSQDATIVGWAALVLSIVATQTVERLSQVASILVIGVFASFAGLVLPGLAHVTDPLAVLSSGPAADVDLASSVLQMTPVFVTTLVYQNIVPTVTRILGYDRRKVVSAITLGSLFPLLIYMAWCVAVLGGGIETTGGSLFTLFSMVTVAGSSIGALISLSEEFEILLQQPKKDTFSLPSVALPCLAALGVCQLFADDITEALKVAGSFGSPLLYGVIPVAMAYLQQQRLQQQPPQPLTISPPPTRVMPGGLAGLGVLGLGATALVGTELVDTLGYVVR